LNYQQTTCYLHPSRDAVEKCEKCNRMICLECKMKYRVYGGMDRSDDIYILCPYCYAERKKQSERAGKLILLICGVICFVILILFIMALDII